MNLPYIVIPSSFQQEATMVNAMSWHFRQLPFWDRVKAQTVIRGECHIFTGSKDASGYGRSWRRGKIVRLHREVWERENGPIPDGLYVCHTCDTPACINGAHLFVGTQTANMQDMMAKGRGESRRQWGNTHTKGKHINVGSSHGRSKFTEDDIRSIRKRLAADSGASNVLMLAKEYGVSKTAIYHIKRGDRWRHVPDGTL